MLQILFILLSFIVCLPVNALVPIKVGTSPVMSSAGIYLAHEMGYFKDMDLNVEIVNFAGSGGGMTMLLAKGELDVGAGNITSGLFNAALRGENFKIVADKGHVTEKTDYIALIVRRDHIASGRYKSLKNLKGLRLALTSLEGVSQQIVAERFLQRAGLSAKDVEFVKLSYAEMNMALKAKHIDATIQIEPYLTEAVEGGYAQVVERSSVVYPRQQSAAIFFSPEFLKKEDQSVKFLAAYLKGIRAYNQSLKDPDMQRKVILALKKHIKFEESYWTKMAPVGLNDDGSLNKRSLADDIIWYESKGYLKKGLDIDRIIDEKMLKKANKALDEKK